MKGVILAAGYGTRFLPASKTIPKEMFPLIDRPALALAIDEMERAGIKDILVITSRRKQAVEDYFKRIPEIEQTLRRAGQMERVRAIAPPKARISIIRQRYMGGTGHALLLAESFADKRPVLVAYPDDLHIGEPPMAAQLMAAAHTHDGVVLASRYNPPDLHRYGVLQLAADELHVQAIVEKPPPGSEPSRQASIGRFVYPPRFFDYLREGWRRHRRSRTSAEYWHIYALQRLITEGAVIHCSIKGELLDVGEPAGYLRAIVRYAYHSPRYRPILLEALKQLSTEIE